MTTYVAACVIVARGKAQAVIDVARSAGAQGATVLSGRGIGHHDQHELLLTALDSERDLIMILVPDSILRDLADRLNSHFQLDEAGNGFLFTMDLEYAHGLVI